MVNMNIVYGVAAVLFGLACAFGFAAITHHPPDIQVQVHQYAPIATPQFTPAPPPPPAITTVPPSRTPDPNDRYAPAPAPVIVTTEPLPTITPVVIATTRCHPRSMLNTTVSGATQGGMLATMGVLAIVIGMIVVALGILRFDYAMPYGYPDSSLTSTASSVARCLPFGIIGLTLVSLGVAIIYRMVCGDGNDENRSWYYDGEPGCDRSSSSFDTEAAQLVEGVITLMIVAAMLFVMPSILGAMMNSMPIIAGDC